MEARNRRYAYLVWGLILVWFVLDTLAAAFEVFKDGRLPPGIAGLVPLVIFALWYWTSPGFRVFVRSADIRVLTFLQSWRFGGFALVIAGLYGILPSAFAIPAGSGDMVIGLTAPLAAIFLTRPGRRAAFVAWQLLGVLDFVIAVTLAVLASPRLQLIGGGLTTAQLTVLPLSIIPTFGVPLPIILHIVCVVASRTKSEPLHQRASDYPAGLHSAPMAR